MAMRPETQTAGGDVWFSDCPAAPLDVRAVLHAATGWMASQETPPEQRNNAELVLAEVCNNIVEHAYCGAGAGRIRIWLQTSSAGLACRIQDQGAVMPGGVPPRSTFPSRPDELPEGGFGWILIHRLACEIHYCRSTAGNTLLFTVPHPRSNQLLPTMSSHGATTAHEPMS